MSAVLLETSMEDVLSDLPEASRVESSDGLPARDYDLWIGALGFESRCCTVAEALANSASRSRHSLLCRYQTNPADNRENEATLKKHAVEFGPEPDWIDADAGLADELRKHLAKVAKSTQEPLRVGWDVSVASNQVVLTVGSILLDSGCDLEVLYSEAEIYHPTEEAYIAEREKWRADDWMGLDRGTLKVRVSSENPGDHSAQLANRLVIVPGYNRDRARSVVSKVDPSFLTDLENAPISWLVGRPHLDDDRWRRDAIAEIHGIPDKHDSVEVSTFDYRETMRSMERIYAKWGLSHNISLAPMGSKYQALGCALFCAARPDVRVMFAQPEEYNASRYTEGLRSLWTLQLGPTSDLTGRLAEIGTLHHAPSTPEATTS